MSEPENNLELYRRIYLLEAKLTMTVEKIDELVDSVEQKHRIIMGDANTPSLQSRVISMERFVKQVQWSLGTLWTAIIGLLFHLIFNLVTGKAPS